MLFNQENNKVVVYTVLIIFLVVVFLYTKVSVSYNNTDVNGNNNIDMKNNMENNAKNNNVVNKGGTDYYTKINKISYSLEDQKNELDTKFYN